MQLVLIKNRIVAHGEGFIAMGGVVINTETGQKYEHATIAECSGCPSDIDAVGYEYHSGVFVPCAPYGKGDGNIMVACQNDCGAPKDSGIPIKNSVAMPLYLTFVGNVNANMVAAAFGKGNEDEVTGIGKALTMYSRYKEEDITFSALQNYDSLRSIGLSQDAMDEVLSSPSIVALMRANAYSAPYIELWRLNSALPEEYRGDSFGSIVQNVEAMAYMYDNYATFEALDIFSKSVFLDEAAQYAVDTGTVTYTAKNYNTETQRREGTTTVYGKKCLILGVTMNKGYGGSTGDTITVGYRPNGTTSLQVFSQSSSGYDIYDLGSSSSAATPVVGKGLFASNIVINVVALEYGKEGTCKALIIPCE